MTASKKSPKISATALVWEWVNSGYTFTDIRKHVAVQYVAGSMTFKRRNEIIVAVFELEQDMYGDDDPDRISDSVRSDAE